MQNKIIDKVLILNVIEGSKKDQLRFMQRKGVHKYFSSNQMRNAKRPIKIVEENIKVKVELHFQKFKYFF